MEFLPLALARREELSALRRDFHRHPEPSHGEIRTNQRIRDELAASGIPFLAPAANITIAAFSGARPGKTVAFRADTDALQLCELTGLPFASENEGLMHACGHDAHIAVGVVAAKMLYAARERLAGKYRIVFQPAEEGEFGARDVMATGLLADVDAFFGIHVWSLYDTGEVHISPGAVCASADMFTIRIHGKGGHGAYPELAHDAVAAGAALVMELQHIVSRFVAPFAPAVLTIGSFQAGTRCNIIAQEAVLEGTLRAFDMDVRARALEDIRRILRATCEAHRCTGEFELREAGGVVVNDEALAMRAREIALRMLGSECVFSQTPSMIGDDFGGYAAIAPCCYIQVGVRNVSKGICHAHHNGLFDLDEDALPACAALACQCLAETAGSLA